MPNLKSFIVASGMSVVLMLSGCSVFQGHSDERTAGRSLDDGKITANVKEELREEPVYKFHDVDVKTFNGVVQLSGFVNTDEQKRRAGELAQHVPGVAQVINNIALKSGNLSPTGQQTTNSVHYTR